MLLPMFTYAFISGWKYAVGFVCCSSFSTRWDITSPRGGAA